MNAFKHLCVCARHHSQQVVLKVWSPENQHLQRHLGTCWKSKLLGPTSD